MIAPGTVDVGNLPATQPISAASLPLPTGAATSALQTTIDTDITNGNLRGSVSLGQTTGKANVLKTGTLVTTAVTADQVVLTYTVTAGKTFYMQYYFVTCGLTVAPANYNTPVIFGTISLETPSGTKDITWRFMGPQPIQNGVQIAEPIAVSAGTVIRVVCTPGTATSLTWVANFGGYEK